MFSIIFGKQNLKYSFISKARQNITYDPETILLVFVLLT
mgnify:CR=1 FL=1